MLHRVPCTPRQHTSTPTLLQAADYSATQTAPAALHQRHHLHGRKCNIQSLLHCSEIAIIKTSQHPNYQPHLSLSMAATFFQCPAGGDTRNTK
jgi:hypothetical protein